MNNDDIQIGDVVRLRSGGPEMTVVGIFGEEGVPKDVEDPYRNLKGFEDGDLFCSWFTDEGKQKKSGFQREAVKRVNQ